jgi:hypothetical protein
MYLEPSVNSYHVINTIKTKQEYEVTDPLYKYT